MTGQRSVIQWTSRSLILGLVMVLAIVATGAGTAKAVIGSPVLTAFARQAQAAGLNLAQTSALQARVDAYLRQTGGIQVAANEIRYASGETLTLTLPGEQRVRALTSAASVSNCPYLNFCAYRLNNFSGDRITAYFCNQIVAMPWFDHHGSWVNNQSNGTLARIEGVNGQVLYYSFAYEQYYDFDWAPVWWIDPC